MFCPSCGKETSSTNNFCVECGESLKNIIRDKSHTISNDEIYLGGTASIHLRRGTLGTKGYGIYATNKRIFGTRNWNISLKSDMSFLLGGVIGHLLLENATKGLIDESIKSIGELEKNKDFEVKKEDITLIEWKKVNLWDGGRLVIKTKSMEEFIVGGDGKQEFEYILSLMQKFYPEVIKIK
jgi:hypothetical protein